MRLHLRAVKAGIVPLTAIAIIAGGAVADNAKQQSEPEGQGTLTHDAGPAEPSSNAASPSDHDRPANPPGEATIGVLGSREVQGILGKSVRSAADEDMGRIVDIIVDGRGQTRAAIIDFGGFLGVGSRKIAVDWGALRFSPTEKGNRIALDLTRDQVKAAPEYKEGKPVVVLYASGAFEAIPGQ